MSVQATSWVWEHSKSSGTARLVLLAIADAANREGKKSYQSAATIATMTGVSTRSVWRAIGDLEELGEVRRSGIHGGHGTTVWELPAMTDCHNLDDASRANLSHDNMARRDIQGKSGVTKTSPGVTPIGTRPQRSQKETPSIRRATRIPENFAPSHELLVWAGVKTPSVNVKLETEQFIDHWTGSNAKSALKLDWDAAWRTWMRNQQKWIDEKQPKTVNGFNPQNWMNQP